jgi:hypothetical protein
MRPIDPEPGERIIVRGAHDRHSLRIWADVR